MLTMQEVFLRVAESRGEFYNSPEWKRRRKLAVEEELDIFRRLASDDIMLVDDGTRVVDKKDFYNIGIEDVRAYCAKHNLLFIGMEEGDFGWRFIIRLGKQPK